MNILRLFFCIGSCLLLSNFTSALWANTIDNIDEKVANEEYVAVTSRLNDSLALVALYNATNGANWTNTWDLAQPMNTWFGVTLNSGGRLVCLDLNGGFNCNEQSTTGNNLIGSIPTAIGQLDQLTKLYLNHNQLSGNIPATLGDLNLITQIYLHNNQLSGAVSFELSNLPHLTHFNLSQNQLMGNIDALIESITPNHLNYIYIYLGDNQFTGSLPTDYSKIKNNLLLLSLRNNQLSGTIPTELGDLPELYSLALDNNQLTGAIPPALGNLTGLFLLYLNANQLSGCFPSELNQFCGIGAADFSNNPNLPNSGDFAAFCSNGTGVCSTGSAAQDSLVLVALYNATNGVNWLNTWDLNLPMDTWYGITLDANRRVTCIDLDGQDGCSANSFVNNGNNLIGVLPVELAQLDKLERLYLSNNQINGSIHPALGQLDLLERLYLINNLFTGGIPAELGDLTNLEYLYLNANDLTGTIPVALSQLSNLRYLYLGKNQLTGAIPTELGNLSNLTNLHFAENQLTGVIPTELGTLSNLNHLWLHDNQLTGNIPATLGQLSQLQFLVLNANQLSNTIPKELGGLTNLQFIWLHDNQLSGCFPPELSNLCSVSNYNFSNNPSLPSNGDFAAFCSNGTGVCNPTDVWPGDTNADCAVNYHDVLTLGVKHGRTGTIRPNATTNWVGQPANDWGDSTPDNVDAKHADCNGDGLVDNSDDGTAISLNYGQLCNNGAANVLDNFGGDLVIQSSWRNPATDPATIEIDLHLESLSGTNIDLYGIGFTVDFSAAGNNPVLSVNNSNLGQSGQNLYAFSRDSGNGNMDIALTRTDGNSVLLTPANGYLGTLTFQSTNANGNSSFAKTNNDELFLRFHNATMNNALGQAVEPIIGSTATATFADNAGAALSFFTHATYTADCSVGGTATVLPGTGAAPFTYLWADGSTGNQIQYLTVGPHPVTVTDANNESLAGTIVILGNCATILPLEWNSFTATARSPVIVLEWTTAHEIGVRQFAVQRSVDGINFNTIGNVKARGKVGAYQFVDNAVDNLLTYYYRIRADEAAKSDFSLVRTVQLNGEAKAAIALTNPVRDVLTLQVGTTSEALQITVYNQMGMPLKQLNYPNGITASTLAVDCRTYARGIYCVGIQWGQQRQVLKIIKQ